uniref:Ste24 endopeptidase n=1 Tax=Ditylenchus dipsaci TaxID=166011 RepID=A0A915DLF8_9BILA
MIRRICLTSLRVPIDFEMAVISALEVVFQNPSAGLKGRYETEPDFAVKMPDDNSYGFCQTRECDPVFAELEELLPEDSILFLIVQKYCIGFVNTRLIWWSQCLLIRFGNVYERTLNGNHRTNNYAEAAITVFKWSWTSVIPDFGASSIVSKSSAGRDQNICNGKLESVQGKRTVYKEADARILRIVHTLILILLFQRLYHKSVFYKAFGFYEEQPALIFAFIFFYFIMLPYQLLVTLASNWLEQYDDFAAKDELGESLCTVLLKLGINHTLPMDDDWLYSLSENSHPSTISRCHELIYE